MSTVRKVSNELNARSDPPIHRTADSQSREMPAKRRKITATIISDGISSNTFVFGTLRVLGHFGRESRLGE